MTKFLLDSGNPDEYRELKALCEEKSTELWGSTTNPSLIAKKLSSLPAGRQGQKLTTKEAFALQKQLVMEILDIVPGAVSAEVYADQNTKAADMVEQGLDIDSWHERVVVKLPTTIEGMKARTQLRAKGVTINNTLVFSQEQVFAISLHEKLMKEAYGPATYPCFISPFVGRLDDKGENGATFVKYAVELTHKYFEKDLVWMLAASIRSAAHLKASLDFGSELITAPLKAYVEWLNMSKAEQDAVDYAAPQLTDVPVWTPSEELLNIATVEDFMQALESNKLDISHPLTTAGIDRFVADWAAILQ